MNLSDTPRRMACGGLGNGGLKELEKEITCSICKGHYTKPKVLPCLHYFCKQCIRNLALRRGICKPFSCPECRQEATLPDGNAEKLPTAFFVNRFKEMYAKQESALLEELKCEICTTSEVRAEAFCKQCDKFVCDVCIQLHPRMKAVFDGHEIVSLGEVLKVRAKYLLTKTSFYENSPVKMCEVHQEVIKLFCFDCNQEICRDCTIKDHRDHNFEFNHVVATNQRKELLESLKPLREREVALSCALEEVQTMKQELQAQGELVASDIEASFDELKVILNRYKEQLLAEAMTMQGKDDAEAKIISADDLNQLCQSKAKIIQLPVSLVINGVTSSNAEVNKESEVRLFTTKLCNNRPTRCAVQVVCCVKSLYDGSLVECKTEELGAGEYRIQYTPTIRGRHELIVLVDGCQVAGNPYSIFVSIPPAQLGESVHVWSGLVKPRGIAVNSRGEVIVTQYDGNVVVLDREGKQVKNINRSEQRFQHLGSIAVDSEDNCYLVDPDMTDMIFKLNESFSMVEGHRVNQEKGPGHSDVAVVRGEVMVVERGNEGKIVVYDRELSYVREMVGSNGSRLCGLFPDSHGNLFVSVPEKSSIQVFSCEGEFQRSFGNDENGGEWLKSPGCLWVAGQYLYVADVGLEKIVVFTTEGDYVASFGTGNFDSVCVGRDGFVYACSSACNKIFVF